MIRALWLSLVSSCVCAQVAFVDVEQTQNGTASTSWSANVPAASAAGNLGLFLASSNSTTSVDSASPGTLIAEVTDCGSSDSGGALIRYELTASDISAGSVTFSSLWSATEQGAITAAVYSGHNSTAPIAVQNSASGFVDSATNISGPSIFVEQDNTMLVQFISADVGTGTYTAAPTGTPLGTERHDAQDAADRAWHYVQDAALAFGDTEELDADIDQSDNYCRWMIAIAQGGIPILRRRWE